MSIPISTGSGAASVATEQIGNNQYQIIKVVGGETGSTSVLGVNPDRSINVSVLGTVNTVIAGSVAQAGTRITSIVSATPSSVLVGASIFGQLPAGTAPLGSIAALQGTNPWVNTQVGSVITVFQSSSILAVPVGSVIAVPVGSVITVFQSPSIVGTYSEDAAHTSTDKGLFVIHVRNDQMSSITSADGDYSPHAVGPVGEQIVANAPITRWVSGTGDFRNGNAGASIVVIAAQGSSVFTYVTGVQVANMGSASVLVTFAAGGSILGYTIAPAGGGSNIPYPNALKTPANFGFAASTSGIASVLVSAQGFISKV